jgi:RNA polymerase sigma-70 factor (ECF subfamily)
VPAAMRSGQMAERDEPGAELRVSSDDEAYVQLVEPHRDELRAHCRRVLGSRHDAEDAVQEALLRAWRGLPRFEGRSSLRAWLYRIATNASLDLKRRQETGHATLEAVDLAAEEATPDAHLDEREAVELAFIAARRLLPAGQLAALVMRDVLGFSARETARELGTTAAAANSALQRGRATLAARLPERRRQPRARRLRDARARDLVERCADAWARDDIEALVSTLAAAR